MMKLKKIRNVLFVPSAAMSIRDTMPTHYVQVEKKPEVGDVVYGKVVRTSQHSSVENVSGRIHHIYDGTKGFFVFGNRYAPDHFEGLVPQSFQKRVDMLARSGVIGTVTAQNPSIKDASKIDIIGYACDASGNIANTVEHCRSISVEKGHGEPAKLILVCGTAMNSGKTMAATACCWALSAMGHSVNAVKVTGTASLKDILGMNDAGATRYSDFTELGYPSSYMLSEQETMNLFWTLERKYSSKAKYLVVEFADGVNQRENHMLLASKDVQSRIHKLVFCAADAFGAMGGLNYLTQTYGLSPDILSGLCSSSPLYVRELQEFTNLPIFNSAKPNLRMLAEELV